MHFFQMSHKYFETTHYRLIMSVLTNRIGNLWLPNLTIIVYVCIRRLKFAEYFAILIRLNSGT